MGFLAFQYGYGIRLGVLRAARAPLKSPKIIRDIAQASFPLKAGIGRIGEILIHKFEPNY